MNFIIVVIITKDYVHPKSNTIVNVFFRINLFSVLGQIFE